MEGYESRVGLELLVAKGGSGWHGRCVAGMKGEMGRKRKKCWHRQQFVSIKGKLIDVKEIEVSTVSIKLLYLAAGAGIAAQMQVSCWTITGERQASRLQGLYFETLLRQEIGYFDTEMTVGQALGMASSDAITIQDAMSAEIGKSIQYLSTFLWWVFNCLC
nr:ABC transporter B family member 7-like [Coffea arabica]